MKVVPFIETLGSEEFKKFLNQPFNVNMLFTIDNVPIEILFDDWRGKNMGTWSKFRDDRNIVLEFYPNCYTITFHDSPTKQTLPLPLTINEFINDMHRWNVHLYWSEWIDYNFKPKEYLNVNEIREYFVNLLSKINKSHELM